MRPARVIVLGQGLAGTLVSYRLRAAGVAHLVVDRGHERASSRAAAGIVNPVTGRRFVLTWRAAELRAGLGVYRELERLLRRGLLYDLTVYRDLGDPAALNQWDLRRADEAYAPYLDAPVAASSLRAASSSAPLDLPAVLGPTRRAARVDLPGLLSGYRDLLRAEGRLVERDVPIAAFAKTDDGWAAGALVGDAVVDCTGFAAAAQPVWADLPWRGSKGQALRFALPGMPRDWAAKRRHFLCPTGGASDVWVGATARDHFDDDRPTAEGLAALRASAAGFGVDLEGKTVEHLAAVRPTVRDRRPLVGEHPALRGLWLCNGLGTKGTSLGPLASGQLVGALLGDRPLMRELDLAPRFVDGRRA